MYIKALISIRFGDFMKNLGLYFHIPFCNSKCFYCDFNSYVSNYDQKYKYIDSLIKEIDIANSLYKLDRYNIDTIFIGGGTPTSLEEDLLEKLLFKIENSFNLSEDLEFSIEINPNSISLEKIKVLKKSKINRISIGLQSTQEKELKSLGRTHSYKEFEKTYEILKANGFSNISIDLMMGIPHQSFESYDENLRKIISLNPSHISAYMLIIEEGTPFQKMYDKGIINIDDNLTLKLYEHTVSLLARNGYVQYEISNFARENFACRHNIKYWKLDEYLGFGQSAHSFFDSKRFSNSENNYISTISKSSLAIEDVQISTKQDRYEEMIFLSLRMNEGIDIDALDMEFGINFRQKYKDLLKKLYDDGYINSYEKKLSLTIKGIEVSNKIFLDFITN